MIRTQISLTEEQAESLRRHAAARGVSMAAVIREALDAVVAESDRRSGRSRALSVVGAFSSRSTDTSAEHDRYLEAAYEA